MRGRGAFRTPRSARPTRPRPAGQPVPCGALTRVSKRSASLFLRKTGHEHEPSAIRPASVAITEVAAGTGRMERLVTSTLLTLLVLPTVYSFFRRPRAVAGRS